MKKKILHILTDDKFTHYAVREFGMFPDRNEFLVIKGSNEEANSSLSAAIRILVAGSSSYLSFLDGVKEFRAVIFHSLLAPWTKEIFGYIPSDTRIGWVFWGREIYGREELAESFLGKRTLLFYRLNRVKNAVARRVSHRPVQKTMEKYTGGFPVSLFKRIDICITDMAEDYEFARKVTGAGFIHMWYNYYSLEEMLGNLREATYYGSNILLGNSMTLSNNHLEAFRLLSRFNLSGRKVITPLSYGETEYRDGIIRAGRKILGEAFVPLNDFIHIGQFNEYLLSCSVCIMNHYRHQALGSTITAIWFGARTYLSRRSTTYSYLKRLGLAVYSIEDDLHPANKKALAPLEAELISLNRNILAREYGTENIIYHTGLLVNKMLED